MQENEGMLKAADSVREDILRSVRLLLGRGGSQARREVVRITLELGRLLEEDASTR